MDSIECPICNVKVSKEKIEKHVDNCLKFPKEKPATRRASMSPSNLEGFFLKKSKRKRPTSPSQDTKKKQCFDTCHSNNNDNGDTTVIPDSPPPLPSIDTECFEVDANRNSLPAPPPLPHPVSSFQNTLLKWSKKNGTSSSSSLSSEEKLEIVANKTNKENNSVNEFKNTQMEQQLIKTIKENEIKKKSDSAQPQSKKQQHIQLGKTPLADQMRPTDFDHYFGQEAVSSSKVLRDLFYNKIIPSLLLWGPPGCGKVYDL